MEEFKTTNIVLASTLICFGAQFKNIELNAEHATFVLTGVTENLLDNWQYKNLRVEPIKFNQTVKFFTNAIKELKNHRSH